MTCRRRSSWAAAGSLRMSTCLMPAQFGASQPHLKTMRAGSIITAFALEPAIPLAGAFDHGDHGEIGEAWLTGIAAVGEQPVCLMTDGVAPGLDPAVVGIDGLVGLDATRRGSA